MFSTSNYCRDNKHDSIKTQHCMDDFLHLLPFTTVFKLPKVKATTKYTFKGNPHEIVTLEYTTHLVNNG